MFKKNKKLVERVKSLLIVLLSCSAVYLAVRTQLPVALSGLLRRAERAADRPPRRAAPWPPSPCVWR